MSDKPQTLAEYLGVQDPLTPTTPPAEPNADFAHLSAKEFAQGVLASPQYRESLLRRILFDELPPAIECLLWHYAAGKPTERMEVIDTTPKLEDLSTEELEARALHLARLARSLREQEPDDDEPRRSPTVN